MTEKEFYETVANMRIAQRRYAKTSDMYHDLKERLRLEAIVDQAVDEYLNGPNLFGPEAGK